MEWCFSGEDRKVGNRCALSEGSAVWGESSSGYMALSFISAVNRRKFPSHCPPGPPPFSYDYLSKSAVRKGRILMVGGMLTPYIKGVQLEGEFRGCECSTRESYGIFGGIELEGKVKNPI